MQQPHRFFLIICLLAVYIPAVQAEKVYRSVDDKGVVEFSDQSKRGAKKLEVPDIPTYSFKKMAPTISPTPQVAAAASRRIQIVRPTEKETIHSNPGDLVVVTQLLGVLAQGGKKAVDTKAKQAEKLQEGEKIAVILDGKIMLETVNTSVTLHNMDRGTHHLTVAIVNSEGRQLAVSESVEFYMKRVSRLLKKRVPIKPAKKE